MSISLLIKEIKEEEFKAESLNSKEIKIWLKGFLEGKNDQELTLEDMAKIIKMIEALSEEKETISFPVPSIPLAPSNPYPPLMPPSIFPSINPWFGDNTSIPQKRLGDIWCTNGSSSSTNIIIETKENEIPANSSFHHIQNGNTTPLLT